MFESCETNKNILDKMCMSLAHFYKHLRPKLERPDHAVHDLDISNYCSKT